MSPSKARPAPRIGLVLGGGGATGGAFHAGVLAALERCFGWDARRAALVVGTSAGSMTGALLRAGLSPRDLVARAKQEPLSPEGARIASRLGPPPNPPRLTLDLDFLRGPAAPDLLAASFMRPWTVRSGALLAAALPEGRVPTEPISEIFGQLFAAGWPKQAFWACAVSLTDGQLVAFGRSGAPSAPVGAAVAASCAIPGLFAPVVINGERYVDGGVHSATNAHLIAGARLDLVLVSSPMSTTGRAGAPRADTPMRLFGQLRLRGEIARVRRRGTAVVAFEPTREDQRVMGLNPLDPARRAPVAAHIYQSVLERLDRADLRERLALLRGGTS